MVFYITLLRWMSNLSPKGGSLRVTHTKKQKVKKRKKKTGGNAQQWIQGYIVQPKMQKEKKDSTGTDNQRASVSYHSCPSSGCFSHGSMKGLHTMAFASTSTMASRSFFMHHYNTKCDKQVSEHAHTDWNRNHLTKIPRSTNDWTCVTYARQQNLQSNQDLVFQICHHKGAALTRWKEQASKSFDIVTLL